MAAPGALPPSGRQLELRLGRQRATVTTVGATLRRYLVDDAPALDGFEISQRSDSHGQLLVPWPNRVADGRYTFQGRAHQLALTEPATGSAIHGLVRWLEWSPVELSCERVTLAVTVHPQPGYEFTLACRATYRLDPDGLRVTVTATNRGGSALPCGLGAHPYLTVGTPVVDDALLTVPASRWLELDDRRVPTGAERPVDGTGYDFRSPRRIGAAVLDVALTGLAPDPDGRTVVELRAPAGGRVVRLWADAAHSHLQLYTGDTLAAPGSRRRGLAVEPMTCAPNAFRSGVGLRTLTPGACLSASWGIQPG
ncbi:MAG TPA: aldose 1-epimerase family protein [Verrucomicrobiae bacterium]|nr:aldose 1-epimerase family protein [Verrucomicrobiae bacterium]